MVKTLEELEAKLASAVDSSKYWARAMTDAKANLTEARAEANLVEANLTEARTTVDSLEAQIVKLKEQAGG
jgi:chromosome segregation ATPase